MKRRFDLPPGGSHPARAGGMIGDLQVAYNMLEVFPLFGLRQSVIRTLLNHLHLDGVKDLQAMLGLY